MDIGSQSIEIIKGFFDCYKTTLKRPAFKQQQHP
jgi:hypothetical protein